MCVCVFNNQHHYIFQFESNASLLHIWYLFGGFYAWNYHDDMNLMASDSFQFKFYSHKSKYTSYTLCTLCVLCIIVFSPLCTCNCLLFVLLLILPYSLNIFKSIVLKPDGKWYHAQHWTNEQKTNWKCFWRIYLDKICLFLIVVQWHLDWFYLFFNQYFIAVIFSFPYSKALHPIRRIIK